jgi:hypothetical protein
LSSGVNYNCRRTEELVETIQYPDGLSSGPVLVDRYAWWDIPTGLTSQAQVDSAIRVMELRYGALKLETSWQGIVGGGLMLGSWKAMWPQSLNGATRSVATTLTPWGNGPSSPPTAASSLEDLETLANGGSGEVQTERVWYAINGKPDQRELLCGGKVLESSSDNDPSEFVTATTVVADPITSYLTRTERISTSTFYRRPTVVYRLRANQTAYTVPGNLISRTRYRYDYAFPSTTAPTDPNQATSGGISTSPYEVVWSSTRHFEGSDDDANRGAAEGDRLLKECRLTDVDSGDLLVERRYLSTTDASAQDVFDVPSPDNILLETRIWTYDAAHRPLTLSVNGVVRESWVYSVSGLGTSTVHVDDRGVQTTEIRDALDRPTQLTLHANGIPGQTDVIPGQTDVFTKWNYASRGAGLSGVVVSEREGNVLTALDDNTVPGGAWKRVSTETSDGLGRLIATTDPLGVALTFTSALDANGNLEKSTSQATGSGPVVIEAKTYYKDGRLKLTSGSKQVGGVYLHNPISDYTTSTQFSAIASDPYTSYSFRNALGEITGSKNFAASGALITSSVDYDSNGRVAARTNAGGTAGFFEVHHWEHLTGGGHAHDTARSSDAAYVQRQL